MQCQVFNTLFYFFLKRFQNTTSTVFISLTENKCEDPHKCPHFSAHPQNIRNFLTHVIFSQALGLPMYSFLQLV